MGPGKVGSNLGIIASGVKVVMEVAMSLDRYYNDW